ARKAAAVDAPPPIVPPQRTQAPSAETATAPPPPAPSAPAKAATGNGTATDAVFIIEAANVLQTGSNAKGPWALYGIKTTSGQVFKSFSDAHFEAAQNAAEFGVAVRIVWEEKTYKGTLEKNLKSIVEAA
ncbi:MAG: hypothetical protein ABIT01_07975, partial [Thermoanaerobaculia bacterium]